MTLRCSKCQRGWVTAEDARAKALFFAPGRSWDCPTVSCDGFLVRSKARRSDRRLYQDALWAALNGLGFPEERACGLTEMKKLFQEHKVVGVVMDKHPTDSTKSRILGLRLSGGRMVHFAASAHGAVAYKVTEVPV